MNRKIIGILVCMLLIASAVPSLGFVVENERDYVKNTDNENRNILSYEVVIDSENDISSINSDVLDQSQTQADNNLIVDIYGLAQSFKPSLSTLTKFSLYLSSTFDISGHWSFAAYRVSIKEGDLNNPDMIYGIVQSSDLIMGSSFWLHFYPASPVSMNPGSTYYIVISGINPTIYNAAELYWWYGSWTSYANGEAYWKDSMGWWLLFMGSADYCFQTFGQGTPDNPPTVVIQTPANGTTISNPSLTVTGYVEDDLGIASFGREHEWTGGIDATSGTLPPPYDTYMTFSELFNLELGWNRIRIFVQDSSWQQGDDEIIIYYVVNSPPNKPSTPSGPASGKPGNSYIYSTSTIDPDGDQVYYQWNWGHEISPWDGPYNSGDTVDISHIFPSQGSYTVKVKAKDTSNAESVWSDPLSVSMPKSKTFNNLFLDLLNQYPRIFEFIQQIKNL